jgi:hypothetical protein
MTVSVNPASAGELLSTPHPAFGHLPHFVEKEETAPLRLVLRRVKILPHKSLRPGARKRGPGGGGDRRPNAELASQCPQTPVSVAFPSVWK